MKRPISIADMAHRPKLVRSAAIVAALAMLVGLAGCTSPSSSSSSNTKSDKLTVAMSSGPLSMDPAQSGNNPQGLFYVDLAYSPLIYQSSNGKYSPGLATSWRYTNSSLTSFELTLRKGVKFSDGHALTAASVVKSLEYTKGASGVIAPAYAAVIQSAQAINSRTVRLNLTAPDPTLEQILSQNYLVGSIIGPDAISNPKSLGAATDGAGEYMLDKGLTVANDHYTYVPNPYYYNPQAIHFKQITVRVISNPQTEFNALKSGQVSYTDGSFATVNEVASSSKYAVYSVPTSWYGLDLDDRDGQVVPALAKQQVRQALQYAINRPAITKSLFGSYGIPSSEISDSAYADGGYVASLANYYPYDPAKAKKLLADAGYPNGFDMSITATPSYGDGVEVSQAIASDWAKIGVHAKIISAVGTGFEDSVIGKQVPAFAMNYDIHPMFIMANQVLDSDAGFWNIFKSSDPKLTQLLATARAQTNSSKIGKAWGAVERRVVELGWFVPVSIGPEQYYSTKSLKGVSLSVAQYVPDPTQFHF